MEESKAQQTSSSPVLPWIRDPVDINYYEPRRLDCVPHLDPRVQVALQKMGITSLFSVQLAVWTEMIGPGDCNRDLCICSPTGSGKTLAYALPIVHMLSKHKVTCLRALVVLPTRELAIQVKEVFDALAPAVGLSVGLAVGQSSIADEISKLIKRPKMDIGIFDFRHPPPETRSAVDILVATPGRLMEHINNTLGFTLEHLLYLVVDESDRLLREDYQSWLPNVLESVYSSNQSADGLFPPIFGCIKTIRQRKLWCSGVERGFLGKPYPRLAKLMLSATSTQDPGKLAPLDLHHPLLLTTGKSRYQLPDQLKSFHVRCKSKLKPVYLLALLRSLQGEKSIVFTNSIESTHRLCMVLNFFEDLPIKTEEYSSRQPRFTRSMTLRKFREGETQVLISSDALARGMDVEGVKNVINYDMPSHIKTYVHRAGRTARAGQIGHCITLLHKDQVKQFKVLLQKAGCECESCPKHLVPEELLDSLRPKYDTALERLKESVESERNQEKENRGVPRKMHKAAQMSLN